MNCRLSTVDYHPGVRITANQVTLARLVLLPVPIVMIYRNTHGWMLGALAVYVVLGLTDALDGYLARKYGSTPLGALLDPVVDKIFLVAGFVPLSDFQIMPASLVLILFVRELAVTALRSIALEEGFSFKTSNIAKLKTMVQMVGAGFILLMWLYQDDRTIAILLGISAAIACLPAAIALVRGRRPSWMEWSWAGFFVVQFLGRLVLQPKPAIFASLSVIVAITLWTGAEYAWGMRKVLAARFSRRPVEALRLAGLSLALPIFYLPALDRPDDLTVSILCLLAAELAAGGIDNSLVQMGYVRDALPDLVRSGVQAVCGAILLWALLAGKSPSLALAATLFALGTTLGDLGLRTWRHRAAFSSTAAVS